MTYQAAENRYDSMPNRRLGRTGLFLPAISLGTWQNFGPDVPLENQQAILHRAFDLGITYVDLANNYGPLEAGAESNFGKFLQTDFKSHRDEMVISTKAGFRVWGGPYGVNGSRKHMLASLDQSLKRLGTDFVDIYYHHRPDDDSPLEETMQALSTAVTSGKALYIGLSSYSVSRTIRAAKILRDLGTPMAIHQPLYSIFSRWIEKELLDTLDKLGVGAVAFSPLAQGLLTDCYLNGIPEGSRAAKGGFDKNIINDETVEHIRALHAIAQERGQTLAQMAIAWTLRNPQLTSALVGASSVEQLESNVKAVQNLQFSLEEIQRIDEHAVDLDINAWAKYSTMR